MIKKEFVENNLLKVLDYLPAHFTANNEEYFLYISKSYSGQYSIMYVDDNMTTLYFPATKFTLIDEIILSITSIFSL